MRVLVTGGAGYIGGFTARLLRDAGHEVTVLDDLSAGEERVVDGMELVVADFGDRERVGVVLRDRGIEGVMHFAGLKSVGESWEHPDRYLRVNQVGTAALLAAMADAGVDLLVYSSTCAVYGAPQYLPVDEDHPLEPMSPYGRSKLLAEQEVAQAHRENGLRYCSLRYFNAAGAAFDGSQGERLDGAANLVPLVMRAALGVSPSVPILGTDYPTPDGTAVRDYIHVLDLAAAHLRALEYLGDGGPSATLNLGTGTGTSVLQFLAAAEEVIGRPIPATREGRRPGDPPAIWANAHQADSVLGWQAQHGIRDIVESAWRWHSGPTPGA